MKIFKLLYIGLIFICEYAIAKDGNIDYSMRPSKPVSKKVITKSPDADLSEPPPKADTGQDLGDSRAEDQAERTNDPHNNNSEINLGQSLLPDITTNTIEETPSKPEKDSDGFCPLESVENSQISEEGQIQYKALLQTTRDFVYPMMVEIMKQNKDSQTP